MVRNGINKGYLPIGTQVEFSQKLVDIGDCGEYDAEYPVRRVVPTEVWVKGEGYLNLPVKGIICGRRTLAIEARRCYPSIDEPRHRYPTKFVKVYLVAVNLRHIARVVETDIKVIEKSWNGSDPAQDVSDLLEKREAEAQEGEHGIS